MNRCFLIIEYEAVEGQQEKIMTKHKRMEYKIISRCKEKGILK